MPEMHQQLAALVRDFEAAQARLDRLAARTPDARWAERADPQRWSVAECVAHLNLTSRAYVPLLEGGLADARASGAPAPSRYRRDFAGWLVGSMTGPLKRVGPITIGRAKTTAAFVPEGDLSRERLLADFAHLQARQIALVREADGLPLDRVRVASPFDARVRYNLWSALSLLPAHQHRHLEQAEEVWAGR